MVCSWLVKTTVWDYTRQWSTNLQSVASPRQGSLTLSWGYASTWVIHCRLNFVILINWVLCNGKEYKSKITVCYLTSSRQLDAFLAPEWDVCFWIVWYFFVRWKPEQHNTSSLPYIIKAAWHFLGDVQALQWDVCFWMWWYPGIRCLVWREKIQNQNMNLLLYLTKAARRFLEVMLESEWGILF